MNTTNLMEAGLLRPPLVRQTNRHWCLSETDRMRWLNADSEERDRIILVDDLPREVRAKWEQATDEEKDNILMKYEKIRAAFDKWCSV